MVNKKFFATCCVIVEAPSNLFFDAIFLKFLIIARVILFASIPGCEKKFLSSADKNEFITFLGIELYDMKILFWIAYSAISCPSPECTLLETAGL